MVIGRFRFVAIATAVVIVAGFAVLGAQIWLLNARIDQLATKVNGIDATFGAKFEETSAKLDGASTRLDAISQRLSAEFKTIGAEIAAQTSAITKSIASLRGLAPSPPTSLLPEPATGPKPTPPPKARPRPPYCSCGRTATVAGVLTTGVAWIAESRSPACLSSGPAAGDAIVSRCACTSSGASDRGPSDRRGRLTAHNLNWR